jgi:hypothetical protein
MFQTKSLIQVCFMTISGQTIWDMDNQQTDTSGTKQEQKQNIVYVSQRRLHKRFFITQDSLELYTPGAGSQAKHIKSREETSGPTTTSYEVLTNDKKTNDSVNSCIHVNTVYINQRYSNQSHHNNAKGKQSSLSESEVDHTNNNITVEKKAINQSPKNDVTSQNVNKLSGGGVVNVQHIGGDRKLLVSRKNNKNMRRNRRYMVKSPHHQDVENAAEVGSKFI